MPFIVYYLLKARIIELFHEDFPEEKRYRMAGRCIRIPKEGGYLMYPNHQGKYDSLGIMYSHPRPCTLVMDAERSRLPIVGSFIDLVQGKRLDKKDMRSQMKVILQIAEEVEAGRRYIVFPEGGYDHNRNDVQDFMPGSFKCATRAKAPIVPVALVDSYKPFGINSLRKVRTQVHFLPPIFYEEYKTMTTPQIAELVKERIGEEIKKRLRMKKAASSIQQ